MSVGILLITDGQSGPALLRSVGKILGDLPLDCATLTVLNTDNPGQMQHEAEALCDKLDHGQGVLILTDLFGSTPSNIANALCPHPYRRVIAGLNLPMLTRLLNYPDLDLDALAEKAISGGRDGVFLCKP